MKQYIVGLEMHMAVSFYTEPNYCRYSRIPSQSY